MSSSVDQFPNDRPPTPLDARRAAERRQLQAQERAKQAQRTPTSDETTRSLAQVSHELPQVVETEDSQERETQVSGYGWLRESFGPTWWHSLGFEAETQPEHQDVVRRIVAALDLNVGVNLILTVIDHWLIGKGSETIASEVFAGVNAIDNYIKTAKRKITAYAGVFDLPHSEPAKELNTDDDEEAPERKERKHRLSGVEWFVQSFGEQWWRKLGIDSNQQPPNQQVATTIISLCWKSGFDADILQVIVNGWLEGISPPKIWRMHPDIPDTTFVNNRLGSMKRKLLRGLTSGFGEMYLREVTPALAPAAPPTKSETLRETMLATRARTWFSEVYGLNWWKRFGFDSLAVVQTDTLAAQMANSLGSSLDEPLGQYLKGWLEGKTLTEQAEAGQEQEKSTISALLVKARDELAMQYRESLPKPAPKASRAQLFGANVSGRMVEVKAPVIIEKKTNPAAKIAQEWSDRLGLNERATLLLGQFLNPTGSNIMDRDAYQVFQKLKTSVVEEFETFDDERLESLNDRQRNALREILGVDRESETFKEIRKLRPAMPGHETVARFIRDYSQVKYDYKRPEELAVEVLKAFETLLEATKPQETQQEAK